MKIAIEARALSARGGGVKTYVLLLLKELLSQGSSHEWSFFYDSPKVIGSFPDAHEEALPLWHSALLPLWLRGLQNRVLKGKPSLIHYTKADIPPGKKKLPTVVTIYDVIPLLFPESQAFLPRMYWPQALSRAAGADHILTISETSKQDIMRFLGVPEQKITVTTLATDTTRFKPDISPSELSRVQQKLHLHPPYILFIATRDQRKNVGSLLTAFAQIAKDIPHQLIIAGKPALKNDEAEEKVRSFDRLVKDRIRFLEFIENEDLAALYAGADLFVWPSVYEGWGFPVQEAMASGVPVIVSNGGALPEVVGQAGEVVKFSTDNVRGRTQDDAFVSMLAQRIATIATDTKRKLAMRQAGLIQAKSFSWTNVAQKTLAVYEKVALR